jgi:MYXO-CTERM domain-containing protein
LPDIQGISIILKDGSITSVDNKEVLAIFGELGFGSTTTTNGIETDASIDHFEMPATKAFSVSHNPRRENPPIFTLRLGATVPQALQESTNEIEFSYRIDGGFYRPWTKQQTLEISNPIFWLQGKHSIEVISRIVGKPATADRTPVLLPIIIDTEPPQVRLVKTSKGYRAEVFDVIAAPEEIKLSWQIGDSPATRFGDNNEIVVADDEEVYLEVIDTAGNKATAANYQIDTAPEATGGCSVASGTQDREFGSFALLALLFGAMVWRRRRRSSAKA